ncbi:GerAB/ArcD/ProY family transporter [Paenibacillus sp. OK060]|uniref:GerAB/ArcD/ProY family transporter n=1 Tax=Paenibacillus sp. OK060 TaxID=1881034 RepID=UPI0035265E84
MLFVYPSSITSYAKESSLICAIVGIPLGVLLMLVFLKIHKASANNGFIQFCIKMLGTGMVCIYLFYFAISASSLIRNVADFVNTQLYPYTHFKLSCSFLRLLQCAHSSKELKF